MPEQALVLVTGGTGKTGSRLAKGLVERGLAVRVASRSRAGGPPGAEHAVFDWADPSGFDRVLTGVERVYLVAPTGWPDPYPVMSEFLDLAKARGVGRVVLLSSSAISAEDLGLGAVHRKLLAMAIGPSVLQPSWFMQNFHGEHPHAKSISEAREIVSATGGARIGFVDANDVADVALELLSGAGAPGEALVLTGPRALSYDEVAEVLSEATGERITHRAVSPDELVAHLCENGLPKGFASLLANLDRAIASGSEDRVTNTVHDVTGRPANSFADFVAQHLSHGH